MRRVLIVDDERSILDFLRLLLEEEGYEVAEADSLETGRQAFATGTHDLVLCDLMMPDGSGMDLLREIKQSDSQTAVVMMTAYSTTKSAIEAMKLGAHDYITKPFDVDELKVILERAFEKTELVAENVYLRRELEEKYRFSNIIGRSARMQEIFGLIERVAKTSSTVLLQGESGTGKELIARAIHFAGPRSRRRFLSVNCGALPETLLESELFGHERGAFTGAVRDKKGLFREADRGTLLLDEVGEMNASMQVKLLRALQEKKVRKIGGHLEEAVDVRIIAATNQDLNELIGAGLFREDLYYRINVIPIVLPPLRRRVEDIPLLVEFFIDKYVQEMGLGERRMNKEALRTLESYRWPGNVRELENVIERALALSPGEVITAEDLPAQLRQSPEATEPVAELPSEGMDLEGHLEEIRRQLMAQALERTDGVQTKAAELLGTSFRSFRYYARKVGLTGSIEASEDGEPAVETTTE